MRGGNAAPMPGGPATRDVAIVLAALAGISALGWAYLAWMPWAMPMAVGGACAAGGWTYLAWLFVMWAVMMTAMMLPSALPMTMMYARFLRGGAPRGGVALATGAFVCGYLAAWAGFSLAATAGQAALQDAALLSPMAMRLPSGPMAGAVLIAAGLYQLTPFKHACLDRCRSPLAFLMTAWRDGRRGAFAMGLHHGAFCVGCCWALMALLFVVGVMNALWIAVLTGFVLVEKACPNGGTVARLAGVALVGTGVWAAAG